MIFTIKEGYYGYSYNRLLNSNSRLLVYIWACCNFRSQQKIKKKKNKEVITMIVAIILCIVLAPIFIIIEASKK